MEDKDKTKEQFITELAELRQRVTELEALETERKQAERALRESEMRLETYLENAPDGVYLSDLKGTFLYGNKKAEDIVGYQRQELIGKSFLKLRLLSAKDLTKASKLLALNSMGRPTGPDKFELRRKDSSRTWVEINTTPIEQEERRVVISFVRNIDERKQLEDELSKYRHHLEELVEKRATELTVANEQLQRENTERKRAEEALRESEEFSSSLLSNSPNPIVVINPDTSIRYVNPALENLTGFSSAEIIGRKIPYPWWTEELAEEITREFKAAMHQGVKRVERLFQKKNS